ncbi:MAG TPA: ribonuclease III [Clostridiales bacterium]|nr:ribonuclease III [Clostridiales bacterium]
MHLLQTAIPQLEQRLGYVFQNQDYLREALTHSTYAYEHHNEVKTSNERLEFLGDAVLDLAIGDSFFRNQNQFSEGFMTKTRALVVCEETLAGLARSLDVGSLLLLGRGEEATGGRDKDSNLANAMEALWGAIYLDGGFDQACLVILQSLAQPIKRALAGDLIHDYKSRLLELAQGSLASRKVHICIIDEKGPVHERVFTAGVLLDERMIASGSGTSKKDAEQQAARAALEILTKSPGDAACT